MSERQEPIVELEHVKIQFGKRTILEDVNVTINEGEFIAILGPNGAGKSTLLKLLLGLIKPSAGVVRVLGRPPRRGNSDIGYAPQHRVLEADLAALDRVLAVNDRVAIVGHVVSTVLQLHRPRTVEDAAQ